MRYSELSPTRRIVGFFLLIVVMAGVWWLAHNLAYIWLPREIAAMLGTGLVGLAVGYLLGQRSILRTIDESGKTNLSDWPE